MEWRTRPFLKTWTNQLMTKSNFIRFVTGTVGSGKKPLQYVPAPDHVGVACVATAQTQELLSRAISPIDMTTAWTCLTGVRRSHKLEMNTVHLTGLLKPGQPVTISPSTDRTTNIFTQSPSELCFIVQIFKSLNHHYIDMLKVVENFLSDLVHALFKRTTGGLLPIRTMGASFYALYQRFNIKTKLVAIISRSKGIDPCIYTYSLVTYSFKTCLNFESKLNVGLSYDV